MSFDELKTLWLNTIRLLDEASTNEICESARTVLRKVSAEWSRRSTAPLLIEDYFKWPSTEAQGGDGRLKFAGSLEDGLLSYIEYRVGRTRGLNASVRRILLSEVYRSKLPPVFPSAYLDGWGKPETAQRLRKLAETLAAFARNAKRRRNEELDDAIGEWEADLQFLYDKFYIVRFGFTWPTSAI